MGVKKKLKEIEIRAIRRRLGYVDTPQALASARFADLAHTRVVEAMVPHGLVAREALARLRVSSPAPLPESRTSRLLAAKQRAARR